MLKRPVPYAGGVSALLDDYLSGDPDRVYAAVWATIRSRDPEEIGDLVPHRREIERAADRVDLGGVVHSNRVTFAHAMDKLRRFARGHCWCANYSDFLRYDPRKEEAAGYVRILSTSPPDWEMTYECACCVCGQEFTVEQGNYHYDWWQWAPVNRV